MPTLTRAELTGRPRSVARPVQVTKFTADSLHVFSGSDDKTVRLLDIPSEAEVGCYREFNVSISVFQLGIFLRVLRPYCLASCPNSLAPCLIYIAPCPNIIFFFFNTHNFCFCVFRQLMNCTMLADLFPCFHRSATKLCPDLIRARARLCPNFGRSRGKVCPTWSFTL